MSVPPSDVRDCLVAGDDALEGADAFLDFVSTHGEAALRRDGGREHFTASCFVFDPELRRIMLCFHRKGRFWVQFGGHLEPSDMSLADAALREAREESGVQDLRLASVKPVHLDRHDLSSGFAWCTAHWDVGFVAVARAAAVPSASDESDEVMWFAIGDLPAEVPPGLADRIRIARAAAALKV